MTARFSIDRCRIVDHCHRVLNKFVLLYFGLCRTLSKCVVGLNALRRLSHKVSGKSWLESKLKKQTNCMQLAKRHLLYDPCCRELDLDPIWYAEKAVTRNNIYYILI